MNYDHLENLTSEDIVTDDENCDASNLDTLNKLSASSFHHLPNSRFNFDLTSLKSNAECLRSSSNFPKLDLRSLNNAENKKTGDDQKTSSDVRTKLSSTTVDTIELDDRVLETNNLLVENESINDQQLEVPRFQNSRVNLPSKFENLQKSLLDVSKNERMFADNSELDNKINDSLLDLLQYKLLENSPGTAKYLCPEKKPTHDSLKYITVFPSKNGEKVINLIVKGKTCRSKQSLNKSELRIVSRILNHENMLGRDDTCYKNVYYDAESDTNIRYEVRRPTVWNVSSSSNKLLPPRSTEATSTPSPKIPEKIKKVALKDDFVRDKVVTTRLNKIHLPSRHVNQNLQRSKYPSEPITNVFDGKSFVDDAKNNASAAEKCDKIFRSLKPSKPQYLTPFSCSTCDRTFSDNRRMALHFLRYPGHKNENYPKQVRVRKKKRTEFTKTNGYVSQNNNKSNKNQRYQCKMRTANSESLVACIQELISSFGAREVVKHVGPIVAEWMDSWNYLLLRSKQSRKRQQNFLISLIEDVKIILSKLHAMSTRLLKPLPMENEKTTMNNKLTIEPGDVLQHILGISPGTYSISDSKTLSSTAEKIDEPCSNESLPKPDSSAGFSDNRIAELYEAAVAECLMDDVSGNDLNEASDKIFGPRYQDAIIVAKETSSKDPEVVGSCEILPLTSENSLHTSNSCGMLEATILPANINLTSSNLNPVYCNSNNAVQLSTVSSRLPSVPSFEKHSSSVKKSRTNEDSSSLLRSVHDTFVNEISDPSQVVDQIIDFTFPT